MAHFLNNKCCKLVCISAIALTSLSSCMKDEITGCPTAKLSLKFDYTYNVKEADAFSAEVKNLNVYVFDKNGKFITATDISTISGTVPADKSAPPASFKAYKGMTIVVTVVTFND